LVALEQIFDRHDMHKKKKEVIKHGDFIEMNIGKSEERRMIKIGKGTSEKERKELINLVQEYRVLECARFTIGNITIVTQP
jgi:hypothetical protein